MLSKSDSKIKLLLKWLEDNQQKSGDHFISKAEEIVTSGSEEYKKDITIEEKSKIPKSDDIPLQNDSVSGLQKWLKIPGVISVYVDMLGSTKLSAEKHDSSTAKVYKYFTDSAIRTFHLFGSSYIDIKGDGVFALFNSNEVHIALCAAITFKTQANKKIIPEIREQTGIQDIGTHIGIDQNTVLVKKIGLKKHNAQDNERQNEVWAGEPINMSAKLASRSKDGEIIISDRYYNNITSDKAITTCGCVDGKDINQMSAVWTPEDITDDKKFSFNTIYICGSNWCGTHGNEYCSEIMQTDKE